MMQMVRGLAAASVIAAGIVVAGIVVAAPAAQAQDPRADHRPCVSDREFNSLRANSIRSVVEARWEVSGRGYEIETELGSMIAYRWCDHGNMTHAYVAVQYRNHGKSGWMEQYDCRWVGNVC